MKSKLWIFGLALAGTLGAFYLISNFPAVAKAVGPKQVAG